MINGSFLENKILLSFCFAGRNDGYLGNFTYRLSTTLNYLARNVERAGLGGQVEAVVTDWNGQNSLASALPLSSEAIRMTRFLVVKPEVAKLHHDTNQVFNLSAATNVAIRRANGAFVCPSPADILVSETTILNLARLLKGEVSSFPYDPQRCLFKLARRVAPSQLARLEPTLEQWDEILQGGSCKFENNCAPEISSGTGGLIVSSLIWKESRGIDESMGGWGFADHEIGLRIESCYPGVDTSFYGAVVYDVDQDPKLRSTSFRSKMNKEIYHGKLRLDNAEDWGLGDQIILEEKKIIINSCQIKNQLVKEKKFTDFFQSFDVATLRQEMCLKLPYVAEQDSNGLSAFLLYWYATRERCLDYLEVGIREGSPSTALAIANPGVSLTYINSWKDCYESTETLWSPPRLANILKNSCKHQGFVRFLNGPIETAVERLPAVIGRECLFDIIHVDMRYATISISDLKSFFSWIRPDGMLILKTDRIKNMIDIPLGRIDVGWNSVEFPKNDIIAFFNMRDEEVITNTVNKLICNQNYVLLKPSKVARAMERISIKLAQCFALCYYAGLWQWPRLIFDNLLLRWQR